MLIWKCMLIGTSLPERIRLIIAIISSLTVFLLGILSLFDIINFLTFALLSLIITIALILFAPNNGWLSIEHLKSIKH